MSEDMFDYDSGGTKPSAGFDPVPDGWYPAAIIAAAVGNTRSGDPKVTVNLKVLGGQYDGKEVRFHTVSFLDPKNVGAGLALHFLKTIGEPYEGKFKVWPGNWMGKTLFIKVITEPNPETGKRYNKVVEVSATDSLGNKPPLVAPAKVEEEVPF